MNKNWLVGLSALIVANSVPSNVYSQDLTDALQCKAEVEQVAEVPKGIVILGEMEVVQVPYYNREVPLDRLVRDYLAKEKPTSVDKKIVVYKSKRLGEVYVNDALLKQFPIALGSSPKGDKEIMGDRKTPEGDFYVAQSYDGKFGPSLLISYPAVDDAQRGLEKGLISKGQYHQIVEAQENCTTPPQGTRLGGADLFHAGGTGYDWTWGCVASDDDVAAELKAFAEVGCKRVHGEKVARTLLRILP